jgi:hypothetical protein
MSPENNDVQCAIEPELNNITLDQESWLRDRLTRLIILVDDIQKSNTIDQEMVELAIEGAINGQALSILSILRCRPAYVNLPKRTWWFSDTKRKNPNGLHGMNHPYGGMTAKQFNDLHKL